MQARDHSLQMERLQKKQILLRKRKHKTTQNPHHQLRRNLNKTNKSHAHIHDATGHNRNMSRSRSRNARHNTTTIASASASTAGGSSNDGVIVCSDKNLDGSFLLNGMCEPGSGGSAYIPRYMYNTHTHTHTYKHTHAHTHTHFRSQFTPNTRNGRGAAVTHTHTHTHTSHHTTHTRIHAHTHTHTHTHTQGAIWPGICAGPRTPTSTGIPSRKRALSNSESRAPGKLRPVAPAA